MSGKQTEDKIPTFAEQVNEIASQLQETEEGKWELPEGVEADETVLYAATIEKRRRNDQSAFTKSRQELAAAKATNAKLASHMVESATMHLTDEQREELDDLKVSDPDEWRKKINEYEVQSREIISNRVKELEKEGSVESQLEARELQYKQFQEETGIELNDAIVDNELPASYKKQLEAGTISFTEFLSKAKKFLTGDKVIKNTGDPKENPNPDLGKLPGTSKPSKEAQDKDIVISYKGEIY